ncbi:Phosphatidylinositol 4-kinase gamma 3 [Linum perenne]
MSIASVALSPIREESSNFWESSPLKYGLHSRDSILVFLSVAGSVIPMHVMHSDSIASVKMRIQASRGIFAKKQKLVFSGRELANNNSRVTDYGVVDGNLLHLVVRLSDVQAIIVRTACGKEFEFQVERGRNVGYVKQQIAKKGKGFILLDHELTCDGETLDDQRLITDICKNNDAVVHLISRKSVKVRATPVENDLELNIEALDLTEKGTKLVAESRQETLSVVNRFSCRKQLFRDSFIEPLIVNSESEFPPVIRELINLTLDGLESGNEPIRSSEGSGGTYFMQDSSGLKYVSVFKPIDEEPMAVNNPQGLPLSLDGEGLKKGTRVGEGAIREVAAYILDYPTSGPSSLSKKQNGFSGVPPTVMIKCLHGGFNHPEGYDCTESSVKIGSLQMFMKNNGSCEDIGPNAFPVDEVHKISVLDIRLANADRHAGNILMSKDSKNGQIELIPIDHGYCLPETFEDCTFEWLYWPQAKLPYSPDTSAYIKALDAEQDIALLKFHGWDLPSACARTLRISTMLLKKGVERGLTPYAIGSIMCRETVKRESVIEQIVREAQDSVLPGSSEAAFLECVSQIMDYRLDRLLLLSEGVNM